jgi:hypothetical protein
MAATMRLLIGAADSSCRFFGFLFSMNGCHADSIINFGGQKKTSHVLWQIVFERDEKSAIFRHPKPPNTTQYHHLRKTPQCDFHTNAESAHRMQKSAKSHTEEALKKQNYAYNPSHYCSLASTIFSLSLRLFFWSLRACLRSFSSFRLIDLISSPLISPAFLTCFGTCLCLPILRISGMCL